MFVSFQWVPRDLRVLWTLSVMVLYTAFLSAFTNDTDPHGLGHTADAGAAGEPTAAGSFDVQARLRGAGPQSLDVLAARERSALFLVQYFNRSLFLKHREGQVYYAHLSHQALVSTSGPSARFNVWILVQPLLGLAGLSRNRRLQGSCTSGAQWTHCHQRCILSLSIPGAGGSAAHCVGGEQGQPQGR
jgi:hypothetical protein